MNSLRHKKAFFGGGGLSSIFGRGFDPDVQEKVEELNSSSSESDLEDDSARRRGSRSKRGVGGQSKCGDINNPEDADPPANTSTNVRKQKRGVSNERLNRVSSARKNAGVSIRHTRSQTKGKI